MKRLALILLACSLGLQAAMTLTITSSDITLSGGAAPTGIQFTIQAPTPVSRVTVTAGTVLTAANKNLVCSRFYLQAITCVAISALGTNNTIADGVIATLVVASSGGTATMTIPSQTDESMTGSTVSFSTSSSSGLGSPIHLCDTSRDGVIDGLDLTLITNWALGLDVIPPGATCDINADGNCDILDVNIVARYLASGGTCP